MPGRSWVASAWSPSATAPSWAWAPTPRCYSGTSSASRRGWARSPAPAPPSSLAVVIGIPCFRFRVVGHYFALVTLAVGEVIRLLIIAERDWTAGSLGLTLKAAGGDSIWAVQFADKQVFYYGSLAAWLAGLWVWHRVDRGMARAALEAIGEDETAAASVGIHVTRFKLGITVLSAALTALGGSLYAQYITYVNPDTLSGIGVSLKIVFAVVLGGMYSLFGPLVGTALTTALSEGLRIAFRPPVPRDGRHHLRPAPHRLHHLPARGDLRQYQRGPRPPPRRPREDCGRVGRRLTDGSGARPRPPAARGGPPPGPPRAA